MRRRRLLGLVTALAMVAVAAAGLRLSEAVDDDQQVRGDRSGPVAVNGGWIEVRDVQVGTALKRYSEISDRTSGMYVAVTVATAATGREPVSFAQAHLTATDEVRYDQFLYGSARADPGFVSTSTLLFEVDPARIDDLTLELEPLELVSGYQQHVQVFLGLTAANAEGWRAAARDQVITLGDSERRALP